jgi:hypothetical protein
MDLLQSFIFDDVAEQSGIPTSSKLWCHPLSARVSRETIAERIMGDNFFTDVEDMDLSFLGPFVQPNGMFGGFRITNVENWTGILKTLKDPWATILSATIKPHIIHDDYLYWEDDSEVLCVSSDVWMMAVHMSGYSIPSYARYWYEVLPEDLFEPVRVVNSMSLPFISSAMSSRGSYMIDKWHGYTDWSKEETFVDKTIDYCSFFVMDDDEVPIDVIPDATISSSAIPSTFVMVNREFVDGMEVITYDACVQENDVVPASQSQSGDVIGMPVVDKKVYGAMKMDHAERDDARTPEEWNHYQFPENLAVTYKIDKDRRYLLSSKVFATRNTTYLKTDDEISYEKEVFESCIRRNFNCGFQTGVHFVSVVMSRRPVGENIWMPTPAELYSHAGSIMFAFWGSIGWDLYDITLQYQFTWQTLPLEGQTGRFIGIRSCDLAHLRLVSCARVASHGGVFCSDFALAISPDKPCGYHWPLLTMGGASYFPLEKKPQYNADLICCTQEYPWDIVFLIASAINPVHDPCQPLFPYLLPDYAAVEIKSYKRIQYTTPDAQKPKRPIQVAGLLPTTTLSKPRDRTWHAGRSVNLTSIPRGYDAWVLDCPFRLYKVLTAQHVLDHLHEDIKKIDVKEAKKHEYLAFLVAVRNSSSFEPWRSELETKEAREEVMLVGSRLVESQR